MLSYPIWKVRCHTVTLGLRQILIHNPRTPPSSSPPPCCLRLAYAHPAIVLAFLECVRPGVETVNFVKRVTAGVTAVTHGRAACSCLGWIQTPSNGNVLLQARNFLGNGHQRGECTMEVFGLSVDPTVRNKIM